MDLSKHLLTVTLGLALGLLPAGLSAAGNEPPPTITKQLYIYFGTKAAQYDPQRSDNPHWNLEILDIAPESAKKFKWLVGGGGKTDLANPAGTIRVDLKNDEPNSFLAENLSRQAISSKEFNKNSIMLSPKTFYYIAFVAAEATPSSRVRPLFNHTFMLFRKNVGGFVFHARETMDGTNRVFTLECLGQCEWVSGNTYRASEWTTETTSRKDKNKVFLYQADRGASQADYANMTGTTLSIIENP